MVFEISNTKVANETYWAIQDGYRLIGNQGGTRSGKSYSISELLIGLCFKEPGLSVSTVSLSFPHLRRGVMRDWQTIMESNNVYNPNRHNKSNHTYYYPNDSYIEFFSIENQGKARGPGRKVLFINEIDLLDYEVVLQLMLRTELYIIFDFNPYYEFHWLYDHILNRDDCKLIKSTYKDNPYLGKEQIKEIEQLKNVNDNLWRVFGLGERGSSQGLIYNFDVFDSEPKYSGGYVYGVDFGFNNPSAITRVGNHNDELFWKQVFYESQVTTPELIRWIKNHIPDWNTTFFLCDHAEPDRIKEMKKAGIKAVGAPKPNGAIDWIKSKKLHFHKYSAELLKEGRSYSYMKDKKTNKYTEEPVKKNDHLMDAGKYGSMFWYNPIGSTKAGTYGS